MYTLERKYLEMPIRTFNSEYIYPPRPESKITPDRLEHYDQKGEHLAQPKLNGSCGLSYTNDKKISWYNRHNQVLSGVDLDLREFLDSKINIKKDIVFVGEYMNKSKMDENNINFNNNYCIHDILVLDGIHLTGISTLERKEILYNILEPTEYSPFLLKTDHPRVKVIKSFDGMFMDLFLDLIKIDMYEGLVLKKKNNKLEPGFKEQNNLSIKCRKAAKNYHF